MTPVRRNRDISPHSTHAALFTSERYGEQKTSTEQSGQITMDIKMILKKCVELDYSRMQVPSLSRGCAIYAPQTRILEGGTKDAMRIFEALFHGSWPKLSTHALES